MAMARGYGESKPPIAHVDAPAALGSAQRKGLWRVRHMGTQTLWVQEAVRAKRVSLTKVDGADNPADLTTKALGCEALITLTGILGLMVIGGRAQSAPKMVKSSDGTAKDFEVDKEVGSLCSIGGRAQGMVNGDRVYVKGHWLGILRGQGCCGRHGFVHLDYDDGTSFHCKLSQVSRVSRNDGIGGNS